MSARRRNYCCISYFSYLSCHCNYFSAWICRRCKKAQYIADARSIYLVVQTEEAKLKTDSSIKNYEYYAKNGYKSSDNPYDQIYDKLKDSSVIKQTGLKHVTVMQSYEDGKSDTYLIAWQSENGKYITSLIKIKK